MARSSTVPSWVFLLSFGLFSLTWLLAPSREADGTVAQDGLLQPRAAPVGSAQASPQPVFADASNAEAPVQGFGRPFEIALTFDDGPHPVQTQRLLDILARHGARATFFVNGMWLNHGKAFERSRELLQRAFQAGHQIGNHTYSHSLLTRLSPDEQAWQIVANEVLLSDLLGGIRSRVFRPPYGQLTRHANEVLQRYGYRTVLWNITAPEEDLGEDPVAVAKTLMMWIRKHQGGIVLLHDRNWWSVDAVELLLAKLSATNCKRLKRQQPLYRIVPLDSFLRSPSESRALAGHDAAAERRHRQHQLDVCSTSKTRMAKNYEQRAGQSANQRTNQRSRAGKAQRG